MSPAVIALVRPRQVECLEEPARPLCADQVRLRTLLSGISAGTEMAFYRGTNPYLDKRWEAETRLFVADGAHSLEYPITSWGYEEVGEVIEVGTEVAHVPIGTRVFGTWGHRAEHVATSEFVRERSLPATADPLIGIFSHIGPIASNGVLDTQVRVGETVAVFGLDAERPWSAWAVIGIANWSDSKRSVRFDPTEFALPRADGYHLVDLWTGGYLGLHAAAVDLGALAPHGVRLLAVHPDLGRSQTIGSTSHLLGDLMDMANEEWDAETRVLTLTPAAGGPPGRTAELIVFDPHGPIRRVPMSAAAPPPIRLEFLTR